ncbi:MAG: hypothetical protein HY680_07245 [Chloroflexi bacterium]|nr:hypothetical protein [Chloroflexota bacterium]
MGITMNSWLIEKAGRQANSAAEMMSVLHDSRIRSVLENTTLFTYPNGTRETVVTALEREIFEVFRQACNIVTYSVASSRDIHNGSATFDAAFDKGPEAMKAYAKSIATEAVPEGWELPNPVYHSVVVAIERPDKGLQSS